VFGEPPLSKFARELLARERGRSEDEAIKSRALDRARAALNADRPSGYGVRQVLTELPKGKRARLLRTLPLIAAVTAAAGLAAAGVNLFYSPAPEPAEGSWAKVPPPSPPSPPSPQSPRVAVGGALVPAPPTDDAPTERPPESRAARTATGPTDAARPLKVDQYATELHLLEPARSNISRGDYAAALTAIAQHRREFPNGQLSQEREALRVRALWGLGQKPSAMAAARAFRKRYPHSSLLSWMKDQGDQSP
jgi:hypothetical protein